MRQRDCFKHVPGLLKIPEVILSLVIMLLTRCGDGENYFFWGDPSNHNQVILGDLVAFGFFVNVLGQGIGFLCGEEALVQSFVFSFAMSPCYVTAGGLQFSFWIGLDHDRNRTVAFSMGALAVVQGVIMLVDAAFSYELFARKYMNARQNL